MLWLLRSWQNKIMKWLFKDIMEKVHLLKALCTNSMLYSPRDEIRNETLNSVTWIEWTTTTADVTCLTCLTCLWSVYTSLIALWLESRTNWVTPVTTYKHTWPQWPRSTETGSEVKCRYGSWLVFLPKLLTKQPQHKICRFRP